MKYLILIFIIALSLTSCKKYPENERISLKNKNKLLSHKWKLNKLIVNHIETYNFSEPLEEYFGKYFDPCGININYTESVTAEVYYSFNENESGVKEFIYHEKELDFINSKKKENCGKAQYKLKENTEINKFEWTFSPRKRSINFSFDNLFYKIIRLDNKELILESYKNETSRMEFSKI